MWKKGGIRIGKNNYIYYIKVNEPGNSLHINGGKISDLTIKRNGEVVAKYDMSWDIKPVDTDTRMALEIILYSEN